jgi:hypothetical protein
MGTTPPSLFAWARGRSVQNLCPRLPESFLSHCHLREAATNRPSIMGLEFLRGMERHANMTSSLETLLNALFKEVTPS